MASTTSDSASPPLQEIPPHDRWRDAVFLSPDRQGTQELDKKSAGQRSKRSGDESGSRKGISSIKQSLAIALGDKAAEGFLSVPLRREAFIQRLTMEENMAQQECACLFLSLVVFLFMFAVYISSGTDHVYRVHKSLRNSFHLDDVADVRTVDSIWGFIANLSKTEQTYIPSSKQFFIHDATTQLNALPLSASFPPARNLQNYPLQLFETFTVTAWVKTTSPSFNIIEKRMDRNIAGLGSTCWRIGVDGVTYGSHEGRLVGTFVTEAARNIPQDEWAPARTTAFSRGIDEGACPRGRDPNFDERRKQMQAEAETEAELRTPAAARPGATETRYLQEDIVDKHNATIIDGEWHLYAVIVRNSTSSFYYDGELIESLPNPTHQKTICPGRLTVPVYHQTLTDCVEGSFYVGDDQFSGQLADVRYFPRELTKNEIKDIISFGAPLDDLVNAGGASTAETAETIAEQEQRLDELEETVTQSLKEKQQTFLRSIKTLRNDLVGELAATHADANSTAPSARRMTPVGPRSLQDTVLTENDTARFLALMDSCYDNPSYHDFMLDDCQWYRSNDASCSLYVDNVTVDECPITCSQCSLQFMSIAWEVYDFNNDSHWDYEEMKAFLAPVDSSELSELDFAAIRQMLGVSGDTVPLETMQNGQELADRWFTYYQELLRKPGAALLGRNASDYTTKTRRIDDPVLTPVEGPTLNITVDWVVRVLTRQPVSQAVSAWIRGFSDHHVIRFIRDNKTCWSIGPLEPDSENEVPWGVEYGEYAFSEIDWEMLGLGYLRGFTVKVPVPVDVFSLTTDAEALRTTAVFADWHHFGVTITDFQYLTFYVNGRSTTPYRFYIPFDMCLHKITTEEVMYAIGDWLNPNRSLRTLTPMTQAEGETKLFHLRENMKESLWDGRRSLQGDPSQLAAAFIREATIEVGGLVAGREGVFRSAGELFDFKFYDRDLSLQEAQLDYYTGFEHSVPSLPGSQPPKAQVKAEISKYPKHTVSIMPAVITQARVKTSKCDPGLSFSRRLEDYLSRQFSKRCTTVYDCHFPSIAKGKSTNYACTDYGATETDEHFGVKPQKFLGESVFADFLHVFDSMIIKRGAGDIRYTRDWIDIQTREVKIILAFYTPTLRIGTLMTIVFVVEQEQIESSFTLESVHSMADVEDILFQVLIYLVGFLVLARLAASFYRLFIRTRKGSKTFSNRIGMTKFWCLVDLFLGIVIIAAVAFMFMRRFTFTGEDYFNRYFTRILEIDWISETIPPSEKFAMFFEALQNISRHIRILYISNSIVAFVFYLYFARIVFYMSAHPRVAVLVRTCILAGNDLFHFLLTFMMLYVILAFIGYFQFGTSFFMFSTISESLMTQFKMLVGSWPEEIAHTSNNSALIIYFLIFALVVVFILLNFFVAIIIEKYETAKYQLEEMACEVNNIIVDSYDLIIQSIASATYRWPPRRDIIAELEEMDFEGDTVSYSDFKEYVCFKYRTERCVQALFSYYAWRYTSLHVDYKSALPVAVAAKLNDPATHPQFVKKYRASTKIAPNQQAQFANPITIVTSSDEVHQPSTPPKRKDSLDYHSKRVIVHPTAPDNNYQHQDQEQHHSDVAIDNDDESAEGSLPDEGVGGVLSTTADNKPRGDKVRVYSVFGKAPSPLAVRQRRSSKAESLIRESTDRMLRERAHALEKEVEKTHELIKRNSRD